MTSIYFNQVSAYPLEEVGQYQSPDPLSTPSIGTQSFSCPLLLETQVHEANDGLVEHHHLHEQHQPEPSEHMLIAGSDILSLPIASENKNIAPQSFPDHLNNKVEGAHGPTKWMSSKMRFMKKMMGSDQILTGKTRSSSMQEIRDHPQTGRGRRSSTSRTNNLPEGVIRMCSDCKTSKTPLWRSGPQGPKSLCNACGIRQRKARRAIAAAALGGALAPADAPKLKTLDRDLTVPFKKRFKITTTENTQNLSFSENTIKFSKNSHFHRGFPQDEKDAAILLMALSCGLLHS